MIKNKKADIMEAIGIIIMFSLLAIIAAFVSYFIFVSGNNYIAVPLTSITSETNFGAIINNGIQQAGETYQNTNLMIIDYGILFGLVIMTLSGLTIGYKTKNLDYFSFLSILTYIMMIFLFILSLIEIVTNWFYNLLINLFPTLVIDLPVMNWFLSNMGLYFLILTSIMFLLNQLDFDLAVINTRKNKEVEAIDGFDDEVL